MPRLQSLGLTSCLLLATSRANGVRASVKAAVADPSHRRLEVPAGLETTDLGCFRDDRRDRVLSKELMAQSDMTPEVCAAHCLEKGEYKYYAPQYGEECWCGRAGTDLDRHDALSMLECAYRCTGDAEARCGGYDAFQAFEFGALAQPAGHLGCFADSRAGRVFAKPQITTSTNTAETCMATCSGGEYAYYGLQYGSECFCGRADEDYAMYGPSDACGYRCTGDVLSTCGGFDAMDIFALDEATTPSPVVTPGSTPVPVMPNTVSPTAPVMVTQSPAMPVITPTPVVGATPAPDGTPAATIAPGATITPSPAPVGVGATPSPAMPVITPSPVVGATPAPGGTPGATIAPSPAPVGVAGDVLVDLVPCLLDSSEINEESAGMYVMSVFFKGYWTSKTETFIVTQADDLTALLVDADDPTPHGKCNAVYVGYEPSTAQAAALSAYSAQFKVRVVYFPFANTHENLEFQAKLGIQTYYDDPLEFPAFVQLNEAGGAKVSITQPDLQTDPNGFEPALFSYPVVLLNGVEIPEREVLAVFADETSTPIIAGANNDQENAAMLSYTGADGHEEMHVFFTMGWFDAGGWPWAHYLNEWATKGIFMGERRFYLGAVVDDLFLATPEWVYDGGLNESTERRCTGQDLSNLLAVQKALNSRYPGSDIITEFAFNGGGIAEKVSNGVAGITYVPAYEETEVTKKGTLWNENNQGIVHDVNWLATNVPLMQSDMADGTWEANDDLLAEVITHLDTPSTFFHGHHTLIHLSRDQLRESDCFTEDTGNVQIALMTGMWDSDNYNWRSMVSPGITGLFNQFCLESAAANLMKCYPGDNTYDGTVPDATVLVNEDNQFHSIYTTTGNNGYAGAQIVPRYATYVYFNCVSGDCLVKENEYIRRFVCKCEPLDPNEPNYTCTSTADECVDDAGNTDIQSFGSIEAIFDAEAATTTRYMLTGRRDKYMFHQANIIPAGDVGGDAGLSLLDYWYERVMQEFSKWVTFPVKSIKFDDLCTDFQLHEALDGSTPYATMALDATGAVTGFEYVSGSGAGLVPLTVPTASAASIPTTGLSIQETETYGTDTTYYLKDDDASTVARVGTKPSATELAEVPPFVAAATVADDEPVMDAQAQEETAEAQEENALVPATNGGLLGDDPLVDATIVVEEAAEEAGAEDATTEAEEDSPAPTPEAEITEQEEAEIAELVGGGEAEGSA